MRRVSKTDGYIATDVFDGRSLGMIDYISTASDGEFDHPTFLAILVKSGVEATPEGWKCIYTNSAKVVPIVGEDFPKPKRKGGEPGRPRFADPNPDTYSDFNDSDFDEFPQFERGESSGHVERTDNDDSDDARGMRTKVEGGRG